MPVNFIKNANIFRNFLESIYVIEDWYRLVKKLQKFDKGDTVKRIILLAVVFFVFIALVICFYKNVIVLTHVSIIEGGENFQTEETFSENQQFVLKTEKLEDNTGTYVSFIIKDFDGNTVYICPNKFRARDLKYIKWDSLNVVVKSGDIGIVTYIYENGNWRAEG